MQRCSDEPFDRGLTSRRLSRRHFVLSTAVAAGTALLAACGGSSAPATTSTSGTTTQSTSAQVPPTQSASSAGATPAGTSAAAGTPAATVAAGRAGGTKTYRVGTPSAITELDPATTTTEVNNAPQEALFDYMVRYTYDPPLGNTILPDLADKWEITNNAQQFVFHIHQGVQFHDNNGELTATDIVWNLQRMQNPKTGSSAAPDFKGATFTAPDQYTVQVNYDHPYPSFLPATLAYTSAKIICPKAYQALGDKWITHPIGSGPFTWGTYQAGTRLTLPKNPSYWGTQPKIDAIDFHMAVDDRTAALAISKGEIDAFYVADPDIAASAASNPQPNVRFMKAQFGISPFQTWFNMRRKPLDDVRVRQALRYAIDQNAIAKDLFGGLAQPVDGYLPAFMFGYTADVQKYPYNPDKARQLLKDANVSPDWAPEMISQSILVISKKITEAVASYWTDIGVKIKNSSLEQGVIVQRGNARDFDMYATYVTRIDPSQMTARFWRSDGSGNFSGYTAADSLIDQIGSESDDTKRKALYAQLQQKMGIDSPAAWIVAVSEHLLLNDRVVGEQGAGWLERFNWFEVDVPAE